jgi:hypothetical protein
VRRRRDDHGNVDQNGVFKPSVAGSSANQAVPMAALAGASGNSTWKLCAGMNPCPSSTARRPSAAVARSRISTAWPGFPGITTKSPGVTSATATGTASRASETVFAHPKTLSRYFRNPA